MQDIFENFPELTSISWRQYTPYFNDGDTCTFSASNEYPTVVLEIDGEEHELEDMSDWALKEDCKYIDEIFKPFLPRLREVHDWISQFQDDELLAMFGDHVVVTLSRNGIHTADCAHD